MAPLLPFAAGLIAGAAAVGLLRSESARGGVDKVRTLLRKPDHPAPEEGAETQVPAPETPTPPAAAKPKARRRRPVKAKPGAAA